MTWLVIEPGAAISCATKRQTLKFALWGALLHLYANEDDSNKERLEALAEIICRTGDEAAAALLVLMGTLENSVPTTGCDSHIRNLRPLDARRKIRSLKAELTSRAAATFPQPFNQGEPAMTIRHSFSLLLALLFVTLVAITPSSSAVVPQKGPHAFGEGQFTFNHEGIDFSFDARANENGKAHGRAQFTFSSSSGHTELTVRINCLNADSFSASMSGVVQHSDDPDYPKHSPVVFAVIDKSNFPVPSSGIDQITPLFVIPPDFVSQGFDCTTLSPLTILDISGNITVEP